MKKRNGYLPVLIIAIMLSLSLVWVRGGEAAQYIELFVNGNQIATDTPPVIMNDRTMVPVRFVAEELGADVRYDPVNKRVLISQEKQKTYNLVKVNGEATTWPYWEEDGHLYLEYRNCIELLRTQYRAPWHLVGFNEIGKDIVIDNKNFTTLSKDVDGFTLISLNDLQRQRIIAFEWNAKETNINIK